MTYIAAEDRYEKMPYRHVYGTSVPAPLLRSNVKVTVSPDSLISLTVRVRKPIAS